MCVLFAVLQQLAHDVMAQDTTLGVAYLLALPNALDANECLDKYPSTAMTLEIAAYYYAIQMYSQLDSVVSEGSRQPLYSLAPSQVIHTVLDYITTMKQTQWPQQVAHLVPHFQRYVQLLMDFNQAQTLQGLGRGI